METFCVYRKSVQISLIKCLHLASPVRPVSRRPLPRHCWLRASSPGWRVDCWAGCTAPVSLSERRVQCSSFQAQRHHQKQTPARLTGLWGRGRPALSSHIHNYLCRQRDRGGGATATSSHKGHGWKCWEAEERGERTQWWPYLPHIFHAQIHFLTLTLLFFFQEDLLNELLAEMKALRAVVLAQSQRIELLERQLARIEDGDVWAPQRATTFGGHSY